MSQPNNPILERPFAFFVALWGRRFRDYFLELCLPCLLAPGNLPALNTRRRSKFLIATRPEDWAAMCATPIFQRMQRHVEPIYLEIPPCPPDRTGCGHMGIGHKLALEIAYRDKAYAVLLTPDCLVSDGAVARLQQLARAGVELVLTVALRLGEEPVLANLKEVGAFPSARRRDTGEPLILSGRQLARAAIDGMHSETARFEWDTARFPFNPSAAWWRVPGENGIVLHGLSWAPLLFDMGAIRSHDTSTLDHWTIDGDYIARNFAHTNAIHVVQDSDEMFYSGLTPMSENVQPLSSNPLYRLPVLGNLAKGALFRFAFYSPTYDSLKRRIFFLPVRWHGGPLNENWAAVEKRAAATLLPYVDPPGHTRTVLYAPFLILLVVLALVQRTGIALADLVRYRTAIAKRLGQVMRGDVGALRRVIWRTRTILLQVLGRAPHGPESSPPPR